MRVDAVGPAAMTRLTTLVMGAAANRRGDQDRLHIQTVYDPRQASLKIVVGAPDDTARVLTLISALIHDRDTRA